MVFFSLLLSLAIAQAPAPQPAQAAPLTVMSFNIRYGTANDGDNHWLKRREHLFALLRDQQADVIGLQEALHGQIDEILQAVPGYAYVGVGRPMAARPASTRRFSTGPRGCTCVAATRSGSPTRRPS